MRHILSVDDLSREEIDRIINYKRDSHFTCLQNKIIGTLFFEPSTRTKLSFHTAAYKNNCNVIDLPENSSQKKGESEEDTVKTMSLYADMLIIRHSRSNGVAHLSKHSDVPVINAGDGYNEHPTQALIDLATIKQFHYDKKHLNILLTGDLANSRTINSLLKILKKSDYLTTIYTTDPEFKHEDCYPFEEKNIKHIIEEIDVLYMTRPQRERWDKGERWNKERTFHFRLENYLADRMKPKAIILHPLPRNDEIDPGVDKNYRAKYFTQVENGVAVRAALMNLIL